MELSRIIKWSTATPDDGDGSDQNNSYPTLIRTGNQVAGDVSGVRYLDVAGEDWAYEIYYKVSLSSLGVSDLSDVQLFWVMECGNDGALHDLTMPETQGGPNQSVPEPSTLIIVAVGVTALAAKRRQNRR